MKALLCCLLLASTPITAEENWYEDGKLKLTAKLNQPRQEKLGAAKNIILFVGDGMGVSTVTAARIFAGQKQGLKGEEYSLSFDMFPYTGLVKTYNTNQQVPDSAGTMTAIMTGVKTKAGIIGLDNKAQRSDCESAKDSEVISALELAEAKGKSTGIVTTTRITHATPAATYAKSPERNWEADSDLSTKARAYKCKDIATQFIEFSQGDGIEVVMGGGRRNFLPHSEVGPDGKQGKRLDRKNLIVEWKKRHPNGKYVDTAQALKSLKLDKIDKIFGLFSSSHMAYEADRDKTSSEPSLSDMTKTALNFLSKNSKGYFLMVEAGRIDHAHHYNNASRALADTVELSKAVEYVVNHVDLSETLVIVTADHSHVFTMAGYPTRGNNILGMVYGNTPHGHPHNRPTLAADGKPYTTLGYANGPSATRGARDNIIDIDTTNDDYQQQSLIPANMETHSGEDVAIYGIGPGSHLITGVMEQNEIFHIMKHMGGF